MLTMTASQCRARAKNVRKLAAVFSDPPYHGDMLVLAGQWDALALAADSFEIRAAAQARSSPRRTRRSPQK